ncbi:MAG TPA: MarR family winged helix-turn-helix transcriptional regulator [Polyangiales bacterium]|nr:MarR family winged helix-turn-helix transcriptional regulator [Polyangiales bacterium]
MPTRRAAIRERRDEDTPSAGDLPPLGGVLEFLRLLWALDHGLNRHSKRMESELGVTWPQRLTIRIIARFPWITAGGLAAILHVHPSTLTGILQRLELRRLLVRRVDPEDGRRVRLGLTAAGKRHDAQKQGTIESIVDGVLAQSSREEIDAASLLLTRLAHALEPIGDSD